MHQFFLSLEPPLFIKKTPSEVYVSPGSDLELCCTATGSPRPVIEWSRGQQSLDATLYQNGCLTMENVKDENTGRYICRATNSLGFAQLTTDISLRASKVANSLIVKFVLYLTFFFIIFNGLNNHLFLNYILYTPNCKNVVINKRKMKKANKN